MKSRICASAAAALMTLVAEGVMPAFAGTTAYTVRPGDTLYKIALKEGVPLSALEAANPQIANFNNIALGQVIHIPISMKSSAQSTVTNQAVAASAKRYAVIDTAKSLLGIRYTWGGTSPSTGFDCSGFVYYVFAQNGITLPRQSHDQALVGKPVDQSALQPGDLVFFVNTNPSASLYSNHVTHVGIYIGNGAMIESSSANNNEGVVIVHNVFSSPYYTSHYFGARSVIG